MKGKWGIVIGVVGFLLLAGVVIASLATEGTTIQAVFDEPEIVADAVDQAEVAIVTKVESIVGVIGIVALAVGRIDKLLKGVVDKVLALFGKPPVDWDGA